MLLRKLTLASATLLAAGLIGWGASAALLSADEPPPKVATALARRPLALPLPRPEPNSA